MQRMSDAFAKLERSFCGNTALSSKTAVVFSHKPAGVLTQSGLASMIVASMCKAEQGADAFRCRGMATEETHWIIVACSQGQDR